MITADTRQILSKEILKYIRRFLSHMEEEENQEVLKTDAEIVLIFNRKKLYATKYVKKCCKLYFSVVEAGSLWYSISAKSH
ncbi:MAG: hypothetical protein ACLRZY_08005 [Blautia hansenii]